MKFLAAKPYLDDGGYRLASAYARLSTERPPAFGGLASIPTRAIWEWLDRTGVRDPIVRRHVENVLSAIDMRIVSRANRKAKDPAPPDKKAPTPRPRPNRPQRVGRRDSKK